MDLEWLEMAVSVQYFDSSFTKAYRSTFWAKSVTEGRRLSEMATEIVTGKAEAARRLGIPTVTERRTGGKRGEG